MLKTFNFHRLSNLINSHLIHSISHIERIRCLFVIERFIVLQRIVHLFIHSRLGIVTWIFIHNEFYIEGIGLAAVLCEALLGVPQFLRNFRLKSTEGMSVQMVKFI